MTPGWRMRLTVLWLIGSGLWLSLGLSSIFVTGDPDIASLIFDGESPGWFELAGSLLSMPIVLKVAAWIDGRRSKPTDLRLLGD